MASTCWYCPRVCVAGTAGCKKHLCVLCGVIPVDQDERLRVCIVCIADGISCRQCGSAYVSPGTGWTSDGLCKTCAPPMKKCLARKCGRLTPYVVCLKHQCVTCKRAPVFEGNKCFRCIKCSTCGLGPSTTKTLSFDFQRTHHACNGTAGTHVHLACKRVLHHATKCRSCLPSWQYEGACDYCQRVPATMPAPGWSLIGGKWKMCADCTGHKRVCMLCHLRLPPAAFSDGAVCTDCRAGVFM